MTPEECATIRSIARWVFPVLVGPSTAVTPKPGARPFEGVGADKEKAMFSRVSASPVIKADGQIRITMRRLGGRDLSFGTSPERIAPESVTRPLPAALTATSGARPRSRSLDQD